ncbi:MAG: tetratricopeptide repeat protein [Granulosicoccus sp.]
MTFRHVPKRQFKRLFPNAQTHLLYSVYVCLLIVLSSLVLHGCAFTPQTNTHSFGKFDQNDSRSTNMILLMENADEAYDSGNWNSAIELYEAILASIPQDAYAWFRLGNALTRTGQINRAIYAYETSLSHNHGQFKPWFNLSTAYLLGAKIATLNSLQSISLNDPSRALAETRLNRLNALLE